jgi:DNA-binding response OmpR family regulator
VRQKRFVVVVNDDPYLLDAVQDVLRGAGYDTVGCKSSSEARELVRSRLPDLIIIDVNLEHPAAGWSFLQLLRLDRLTAGIPVIVTTADVEFLRTKVDHLRQTGCSVLEKPFSIDALLREVTTIVPPPSDPAP